MMVLPFWLPIIVTKHQLGHQPTAGSPIIGNFYLHGCPPITSHWVMGAAAPGRIGSTAGSRIGRGFLAQPAQEAADGWKTTRVTHTHTSCVCKLCFIICRVRECMSRYIYIYMYSCMFIYVWICMIWYIFVFVNEKTYVNMS